jgi:glycosyltransferase involved in cell wall biosynthesis
MKILQINKCHYIKGGADRVYLNTSKLLEDNHNEVMYFSSENPNNLKTEYSRYFIPSADNRQNSILQKLGGVSEYIYSKKAYDNLSELIADHRPDIAHLHLFYGGLSASVLKALKNNKVPVVQSVHDYRLLCPANAFLDSKNQICEKCRNKSYYQCSLKKCNDGNFFYSSILSVEAYVRKYLIDPVDYINHFIFVSNFAGQKHLDFDSRYGDKSTQLYNFTDIPKEFSTSSVENYFLYFGRLSKEKGLLTLLAAFEKSDFKLKIAGTGPLQDEVVNYSNRNSNIEFYGHQSGSALTDLIKGSSFIIVPSEWYENNPMTVIEAYANGIPVIGARIGGIPEIIVDKKTGFLFESRSMPELVNALTFAKQLTQNEYIEMSLKARAFAEQNFSSATHYQKLMQIYSQVLKDA